MALWGIMGICHRRKDDLHASEAIKALTWAVCDIVQMQPVGEIKVEEYPHWPGKAPSTCQMIEEPPAFREITATQMLGESAITVHTYPEVHGLSVLVDSCADIPDLERLDLWVIREFGLETLDYLYAPTWNIWRLARDRKRIQRSGWPTHLRAATLPFSYAEA